MAGIALKGGIRKLSLVAMDMANEDLKQSMEHVIAVVDSTECFPVEKMKLDHVLSEWLKLSGLASKVTKPEDMSLLDPFWEELEKLDVKFGEAERLDSLADWLEES